MPARFGRAVAVGLAWVLGAGPVPGTGSPAAAAAVPERSSPAARARAPRDEVDDALAHLTGTDPEERQAAQRWLTANLELEDVDALARTLRGAPPDRRRRVVLALGGDDRHLELAALLATETDPDVRASGEEALHELLARWSASVGDAPLPPMRLPDAWAEELSAPLSLDPTRGSLATVLDRLDRLGRGPVPLVLDPGLDPAVRRDLPDRLPSTDVRDATWGELLTYLCAVHRVRFELHGERAPGLADARRSRAWVRVCKRGDEGRTVGADLLVDWVRGVLRLHDPRWNRACAVALAGCGWPAAVDWLERRWVRSGDPAALAGLLHAAARGRAAPSLADPGRVRHLLARADARLAANEAGAVAHAELLAHALGALGATALDGSPMAPLLLEGWDGLPSRSRWLRLVAAEAQGRRDPRLAAVARATLVEPGAPRLRLAALETLLVVQDPDPEPTSPAAPIVLLEAGAQGERLEATARGLAAVGARPDPRLTADALRLEVPVRLALVEWLALAGEPDRAAGFLGDERERRALLDLLAERLRDWAGLGLAPEGRALVEALGAVDGPDLARRLALRAGLADAEERAAAARALLALGTPDGEDWTDLACLAADPVQGEAVRARLLAACEEADQAPRLLPACARAVLELRRARLAEVDEAFQTDLRAAATRSGHPLANQLFRDGWPPRAPVTALQLEALDRVWAE